jgi:hypothetical protein
MAAMSALDEFKKMIAEAVESQKKDVKEISETSIILNPTNNIQVNDTQINEEETIAQKTARYLTKKSDDIPAEPKNIEAQRWNDPLRKSPTEKFVTFKEMDDHYGLFLQRIQQQMSTMGGGGEVRFSRLDDVSTAGISTNKFLTYNSATKKFTFDYIPVGDGLELDTGTINLKINSSFDFETNGELKLKTATTDRVGGIKAGPGVTINSEGQILIDSSGLEFSFGDFQAIVGEYSSNTEYALLSSVNEDEDIVIASNGAGAIKVVGQFDIHKTNGTVTGSLEDYEPFFRVKDDGQVRILVPLADTTEGGVEIIGSLLGTSLAPGIAGTMLHLTGNAGESTRIYHDTLSDYGSYVFRRYNGSVASPTAVLINEDIGRINFTAATSSGMGNVATSQIRITALENQTPTAQGSKITFTVTPVGSAASSRVDVATISVADGVSATKFTGPLIGNANTATTATNLAAATGILAGTLNVDPPNVGKNGSATATYTLSGLTTDHKVIVMPQGALPDEFNITAAWASAANTLSIQYQTYGGGVNATAFNVAYFAWV